MKIKLSGYRGNDMVRFSVRKNLRRFFPPYFLIEIDTKKIKQREKNQRA